MAQQIQFAPFPGTPPLSYVANVRDMLSWIDLEAPGIRGVREWLRSRELFDKDGHKTLLELLDIHPGEPVSLGPLAREILDADGESEVRARLAGRLVSRNPLLAKYCLEALDADRGGRLHSTNELYRLVTSYVYPGLKPTLPSFRGWVEWAAAAGLLKIVGIRWALGEGGVEVLPRLRAIDAEEFMEEERAADHATDAPRSADHAPDVPRAADHAPDAPRSAAAGRRPEPAGVTAGASDDHAQAMTSAPSEPLMPPTDPDPGTGLERTRDLLLAWWSGYPRRRQFKGRDLGVSWSAPGDMLPLEAAFAALLYARGLGPPAIRTLLEALRDKGILADGASGRLSLKKVGSVMAANTGDDFRRGCEALVHLPRLHAGISEHGLLTCKDPRELASGLWRALYEPHDPMAPFILARLLHDQNLLPAGLSAAAFIPTYDARESAFRIGFLERLYTTSFGDLMEAGVTLSALFGPPYFEGPLSQAPEGFGCTFRCGRTSVCPLDCRERSEAAPARFP
jgi:hypothetical protein